MRTFALGGILLVSALAASTMGGTAMARPASYQPVQDSFPHFEHEGLVVRGRRALLP